MTRRPFLAVLALAALVLSVAARAEEGSDDPRSLRGKARELFAEGKLAESIAAFDKLATKFPPVAPSLWERGLALWYVGEFAKAAEQFAAYDTVGKTDIENGLWHYLSVAKAEGAEAAGKKMIGYDVRTRPPFPALLDLFTGKGTAEAVDKQAVEGLPEAAKAERDDQRFHADLYVGKWHQINGRHAEALKRFEAAVGNESVSDPKHPNHFMWLCAKRDRDDTKKLLEAGKAGKPDGKDGKK
jgi:lipoprotein NlpI